MAWPVDPANRDGLSKVPHQSTDSARGRPHGQTPDGGQRPASSRWNDRPGPGPGAPLDEDRVSMDPCSAENVVGVAQRHRAQRSTIGPVAKAITPPKSSMASTARSGSMLIVPILCGWPATDVRATQDDQSHATERLAHRQQGTAVYSGALQNQARHPRHCHEPPQRALFRSCEGGRNQARIARLIATCKKNGVEPFASCARLSPALPTATLPRTSRP